MCVEEKPQLLRDHRRVKAAALGQLDVDEPIRQREPKLPRLAAASGETTAAGFPDHVRAMASYGPRLRAGDRVRINHHARPNYLHGQPGTVTGWAGHPPATGT
jgi:prophage DNA circulation protein